jgi:hypothetical protein
MPSRTMSAAGHAHARGEGQTHAPGEGHAHAPGEGHTHARGEGYAARKHPEFVALDIGGDVGALIVHTGAELHGVEIEISPARDDRRRSHKQVLERSIDGEPAFTAVFDGLPCGAYTLWVDGRAHAREVRVPRAAVAQLDWR